MVAVPRTLEARLSQSPVDVLMREHDLTRRMLTVLERIATQVEVGVAFPAADTAKVLTFFRDYVEQVHHVKESRHCFPAATMLCRDAVAEAVGRLVAEHDEGKILLHSLTLFWEPGDLLILFSDGIHEALSTDDEEFGEERLERVILGAKDEEPRQVRDRILHAVAEHSRGVAPADDVTVVVAKAR